jgi:hypothetical protein
VRAIVGNNDVIFIFPNPGLSFLNARSLTSLAEYMFLFFRPLLFVLGRRLTHRDVMMMILRKHILLLLLLLSVLSTTTIVNGFVITAERIRCCPSEATRRDDDPPPPRSRSGAAIVARRGTRLAAAADDDDEQQGGRQPVGPPKTKTKQKEVKENTSKLPEEGTKEQDNEKDATGSTSTKASGLARVKQADVLAVQTKVEITPDRGEGATAPPALDDSRLTPLQRVLRTDLWSDDASVVDGGLQQLASLFDTTGTGDRSRGEGDDRSLQIAGGVSVAVGAMRKWRGRRDVQVHGCAALDRIVGFGHDARDAARDAGALDAIVWGMRNYSGNLEVQTAGCSALGTMLSGNEFNAIYLEKGLNGSTLIVGTMKNHMESSKLQSLCLQILSILSDYHDLRKPIVEAGGLSALAVALETHTGRNGGADGDDARLIQGLGKRTLLRLAQQLCDDEEEMEKAVAEASQPQQQQQRARVQLSPYEPSRAYDDDDPAQHVLQDEVWKAQQDRDSMLYW